MPGKASPNFVLENKLVQRANVHLHDMTCKHVPPAAARLFRMLPLVPFNGRQTMTNCTCIQLLIKHSNIKTP